MFTEHQVGAQQLSSDLANKRETIRSREQDEVRSTPKKKDVENAQSREGEQRTRNGRDGIERAPEQAARGGTRQGDEEQRRTKAAAGQQIRKQETAIAFTGPEGKQTEKEKKEDPPGIRGFEGELLGLVLVADWSRLAAI